MLDTIGGDTVERSLDVLRPGGHLVTAVAEEDTALAARYEAAGMRFSGIAVDPDPVAAGLVDLVEQANSVHVQETFPFERVAEAHRRLDAGHLQASSSSLSEPVRGARMSGDHRGACCARRFPGSRRAGAVGAFDGLAQ